MNDATTVTPERAAMLAAHAIHVQGGFSTPAVEKARAEHDIANGNTPDWEQMEAEVQAAMLAQVVTVTPPAEEVDAQLDEGLAPMPEDIQQRRLRKLEIDKEMAVLNEELTKIKGEVDSRLTSSGLQGFTLHGKVKARKSFGTRTGVDSKELKKDLPAVYQKYLKVTHYTAIKIT